MAAIGFDRNGMIGKAPPLKNLPIPELETPLPILAWNAAKHGLPSFEFNGLIIKNPKIGQHPPASTGRRRKTINSHDSSPPLAESDVSPPANGFILQGDVDLFGTNIIGKLEKWVGPPPPDVVVGIEPPVIERITLLEDFHLSAFIPLVKGTPFDVISFRNAVFYRQNYVFDKTKTIGWHFSADWVIGPSRGLLHEILSRVLKVDEPVLNMQATLRLRDEEQQWNSPLRITSFIVEGVFSGLTLAPTPGLRLTSIGVRFLAIRGFEFNPVVFGTMALDVPGSVVPLDLVYEMRIARSSINLRAELSGRLWENALGVRNLMLKDVTFATSFSTSSPWESLVFDVSATFTHLTSQIMLSGTFSPGGHFGLTAEVHNFGTQEIDSIFSTLFSDSLTLPEFDVHIDSAVLSIASGKGLSLSLHNVQIAGHTALDAAVSFTSTGVSLSGALSSSVISFGDVSLHDAALEVSFWTNQKKKQVDLMLGGTIAVDFLDMTVKAAVHLYPGPKGVDWAVVAGLSAPDRSFSLSDVVSPIKGTFLDFSLKDAVIIAASQDDSAISRAFPGYTVRQGVQVAAVIDRIPAINNLLRQDVSGLVLNAGWSKTSGFNLEVSLPASTSLDLGNGIRTTPITLAIRTQPVELAVIAGLTVPVKDSTPLDFSFILAANATGASASAEMDGWWKEPFGIDRLKVGPTVVLSIEIVYAQFLATGTPSGFGLAGGLMIGSAEAHLAMNISEDPQRQLLSGSLKKLGVSDVVTFAGELIHEDIPKVPDLIRFEELSISICPFGIVLGKTTYPQGFSFKADLLVLEKRANIECNIDKANKCISIAGGLDNFELGPLSLQGFKGPRAELECQLGVSKQQLTVDGVISLFDSQVQTYANMQFLPDPQFKFHTLLKFADIFMFQLDAELIGSLGTSLKDADFSLYANLENNILDYVAQQIVQQLEAAKMAATQGIAVAEDKVKQAKKEWQEGVDAAQRNVDEARRSWQSFEKSIRESSQPIIDNWIGEIARLQHEIDKASKVHGDALRIATDAVEQANRNRGAAIAAAERDVQNAQRSMDNGIDTAQRALNDAKAALDSAFGDAHRAINEAQQKVWSLESQIRSLKDQIRECENASGWDFWKKGAIPGLWISVGAVETAKVSASLALDVARAVLTGSNYIAKSAGVDTARGALEIAKQTGRAGLSFAEKALQLTNETTEFAVNRAKNVLQGVQAGTSFIAFEGAKQALKLFEEANRAVYNAALVAVEGLMNCTQYLTFMAAQVALSVAKNFRVMLDAANDALKLANQVSTTVLNLLQDLVNFGARAINIQSIILSGTLRGIIGIGGATSRPFYAAVKGYVLGERLELSLTFDPSDVLSFIKSIFKEVWEILKGDNFTSFEALSRLSGAAPYRSIVSKDVGTYFVPGISVQDQVEPLSFLAAKAKFIDIGKQAAVSVSTQSGKAQKMGLFVLPQGPFTAGPPKDMVLTVMV